MWAIESNTTICIVLVNPPTKYFLYSKYLFIFKYITTKFINHIQPKDNNLQHHKHCWYINHYNNTVNILLVDIPLYNTVNILLVHVTTKIYHGDALVYPLHISHECYQRRRHLGKYKSKTQIVDLYPGLLNSCQLASMAAAKET